MNEDTLIRRERPDQPDVMALLDALDGYLAGLYAPDENHLLDVAALLAPQVCFLVARRAGHAVGCGAMREMAAEPASGQARYGEIKRMYVAPAQRGQGIAARLLEALEAELRRSGIGQALLETGGEQHEALRLYRRSGYRPCAAFAGYPDNGKSVFLRKLL